MAHSRINEQIIRKIMVEMNSKSSQSGSDTDEENAIGLANLKERLGQLNTDGQTSTSPSSSSSSAMEDAGTTNHRKNTKALLSPVFSKGMYEY